MSVVFFECQTSLRARKPCGREQEPCCDREQEQNAASFGVDLRRLQSKVKCTDKTLFEIINIFSKYTGLAKLPKSLRRIDKELKKKAGCSFLRLHGCTKCRKHVYDDGRVTCPICGESRYDEENKPREVFFFFVLFDI